MLNPNTRSRRNVLDVDLNALPRENLDHEGSSADTGSHNVPGDKQGGSTQPATIDVEAFDDEIFISSPRAFAEANNSRRHCRNTVVVDVDSEERTARDPVVTRHHKRRRLTPGQASRNSDALFINLEGSSNNENVDEPPSPPPCIRTYKCPVCLGPIEDATSTKCGHIFCKDCLKAALAAQGKCPMCRKRSNMKGTVRVYLPALN